MSGTLVKGISLNPFGILTFFSFFGPADVACGILVSQAGMVKVQS